MVFDLHIQQNTDKYKKDWKWCNKVERKYQNKDGHFQYQLAQQYSIKDMISKQQIVHKLEIILTVSMQVADWNEDWQRFIHLGKQEINMNEEVELKGGLVAFSEVLKLETIMLYDGKTKKYEQKKVAVTVYVVSPRGKNVAGVFPIDLATILNKPSQEQSFTHEVLQRCPDKDAKINLKIKGIFLEQLADANMSLVSERSGVYTPSANRILSGTNDRPKIEARYPLPSPRLESNLSQKKIERNYSQNRNKRSFVEEITTPIQNRLVTENRSDLIPKSGYKQDPTVANENFKFRSRIDELQRQIDSLKRQLLEKKRLQNQVDSLNYKISELQKVINGNRLQIDNSNKQKRRGNTELSNKIQQLQKLNLTLQKRVDVKSTFYKQQLQKYNSKLLSIQNEKQHHVLQISSLKDQNFDLNRKINALKDKQKLLNDDKIKLTKRIEELKKLTVEKQSTAETSSKDVMYERLKQTISNNELEKLSLMDELEKLKNQVLNQGIFRTKYEQELKDKNNVIQQKLYLENQHALTIEESTNEANKLNKQITDKIDEIHVLNTKIVDITTKNKFEVARLLQQIASLKSTLEFVRGTEEKGRNEYEELNYVSQQNHRQLLQANKRCASLDSTLKEFQLENEQLKKNLKGSIQQGRNLAFQIQKLNSIIADFEDQFTMQTQSKRKNQQQYKSLVQKLQASNKQLQQQLSLAQQQIFSTKSQLQQQQNDFNEQIQRKDITIREKEFELRNVFEEETQLQMKNASLESKQIELRQIVRALETQLNKEKNQNQNLKKNTNTIQESESHLKQQLSETKNNLEQKQMQCQNLTESNKILDNLLTSTRNEFEAYKQNINEHLHGLLKSLVTRNKVEEPLAIEGMSQGLVKLESDVISKVKTCYEQLEVITQKLLNKEMDQITNDQNNNLQIQTLHLELTQVKKQLELSKNENTALLTNLETNKGSYLQESQNLMSQIKQLQTQMSQQFSLKFKESTTNYERELAKVREQQLKQKSLAEQKIKQLEAQLTNLQKELYDQYNEVNVMSLKGYENQETIKELESRLQENNKKSGFLQSDRNKFISDIMYLEQNLHRVASLYQTVDKNLILALQRQAILTEQNEYLRGQFETKSTLSSNSQFQQRQRNIVQIHRVNAENMRLNQIVQQLQLKLQQKNVALISLQQKTGDNNSYVQGSTLQ